MLLHLAENLLCQYPVDGLLVSPLARQHDSTRRRAVLFELAIVADPQFVGRPVDMNDLLIKKLGRAQANKVLEADFAVIVTLTMALAASEPDVAIGLGAKV